MGILLQVQTTVLDTAKTGFDTANTPVEDMNGLEFIMKGGPIMIPIFILLLISIYILIERMLYINKRAKVDKTFLPQLKMMLERDDINGAKMMCATNANALSNIINSAISAIGRPAAEVNASIEDVASHELGKMERGISYLGIIAGIAPMLGFIGTISGIIKIFYNISLSDNISIGIIAGGLYEKMITSGSGLLVGVFAYTAYHFLHILIDKFSLKMEGNVIEFKNFMQNPS